MRSATAFLPSSMTTFMNLASSTLPNLGSGRISRLDTSRRRGMLLPCVCSVEPCHEHGHGRPPGRPLTCRAPPDLAGRSEEHTSELQSLMRISYAVFCLEK